MRQSLARSPSDAVRAPSGEYGCHADKSFDDTDLLYIAQLRDASIGALPRSIRSVDTRGVASMHVMTPSAREDQLFVLSNLPPTPGQKRLALKIDSSTLNPARLQPIAVEAELVFSASSFARRSFAAS